MKILFLLSSLETGGAERVAAALCASWAEIGHDVVLMPTFGAAGRKSAFAIDARVSVVPIADICGCANPGWFRKVAALRREIRHGGYDVVISFLTNVNVLALVAGRGAGVPVVVSERTYPPSCPVGMPLGLARKLLYPGAAMVVLQTREGLEWLYAAIPRAHGCVLPNPVVHPLPQSTPRREIGPFIGPQQRVLLAVGRLAAEKRFDWLIARFGAKAAKHPDWTLVILGEGPERERLHATARDSGVSDKVFLPGSAGNLHDWYRRADAFVSTSVFEGFPNSLAEALSYAVPALAVDCPTGPAELVIDGENGILLPRSAGDSELDEGLTRIMTVQFPHVEHRARELRNTLNGDRIAQGWLEIFASASKARRLA